MSRMGFAYWLVRVGQVMSSKMITTSSAFSASLLRGSVPRGFSSPPLISASERAL